MSEASVIIDGIRSPLLEFGPANSDEAVLFVHGNPGSIRDWGALARGAGEFGRAVAIDMPGLSLKRIAALYRK
jgi:pimeloyl-ACP methyl ester carboxylesterase